MTEKEHIMGALMGVAYGDAMGMPSEFFTRSQIREKFGEICDLLPGHPDNIISSTLKAGDVTDDTLLTLLVCEMLIENGGEVDPELLVSKILSWEGRSKKSNHVLGPSTRSALKRIIEGSSIAEAGKNGTTNGAAMKVTPLGMINDIGDLPVLVEQVHLLCMPTHNTSAAISGACAVATAISCAVSGETSVEKLITAAVLGARLGECKGYQVVSPNVADRILWAVELVSQAKTIEDAFERVYTLVGTGLPIADSVPSAFAMLRLSEGDPVRCAHICANLGGDTDSIGSMATSICGALRGPKAFDVGKIDIIAQGNDINFEQYTEDISKIRRDRLVKTFS